MNHSQAIQVLEELLPQIKETRNPEGVLLKYARAKNLAPAQLEKMAQVYNTAKTLTYYDKAPERGGSFSLVNPQNLIRDFVQFEPKAASTKPVPVLDSFQVPGMDKAASTRDLTEGESRLLRQAQVAEGARLRDNIRNLEQTQALYEGELIEKVASIRDQVRVEGAVDRQTLEGDVLFSMGKEAGTKVLTQIFPDFEEPASDTWTEKRAWSEEFRSESRLRSLEDCVEVLECMKGWALTKQAREQMEKEASSYQLSAEEREKVDRDHAMNRRRQGLEAADSPDPIPVLPDDQAQELDLGQFQSLLADNFKGPAQSYQKAVRDPLLPIHALEKALGLGEGSLVGGTNSKQKGIDQAADDTQASLALARLIQVDPIISEADPELIEELYNTFRSVNPEFVRDPARLRLALREAIQYGAVPTHTLSELAQIRKTLGESRDREQKAEDKEYDKGLGRKKD